MNPDPTDFPRLRVSTHIGIGPSSGLSDVALGRAHARQVAMYLAAVFDANPLIGVNAGILKCLENITMAIGIRGWQKKDIQ